MFGKKKESQVERVILHSDLNNFYASVECLYNPKLKGKPVAVCGRVEERHGIVLAKNTLAKKCGVKTGEAIWQARLKCPDLVIVPPNFDRYLKFSKLAREIYCDYTDQVESFGLDECWLDVTGSLLLFGSGEKIAQTIRKRIKAELGITVSIGVSFNKIFAKLGSDLKKPDAVTVITQENFKQKVWPLPVEDLLYVGPSTCKKLRSIGIFTIGDLAKTDVKLLGEYFGKNGVMLWSFANGQDQSRVSNIEATHTIKSIGNSMTMPRDLVCDEDVKVALYVLCDSVAARLREYNFYCTTVQISLRDNDLYWYERQGKLNFPTCSSTEILSRAFELYKANHKNNKPLRSVGVRACGLVSADTTQLSMSPDFVNMEKWQKIEGVVDKLRYRFGHHSIMRGILFADRNLSGANPKDEHIIHPVSFFNGF